MSVVNGEVASHGVQNIADEATKNDEQFRTLRKAVAVAECPVGLFHPDRGLQAHADVAVQAWKFAR